MSEEINVISPVILSRITDAEEEVVTSEPGITYLQVITSDKGRANKLMRMTTESEFIKEFGTPDYKKHGLCSYNATNFLKNGVATFVLRAAPIVDTEKPNYLPSSVANAFLDIQTKKIDGTPERNIIPSTFSIEEGGINKEDFYKVVYAKTLDESGYTKELKYGNSVVRTLTLEKDYENNEGAISGSISDITLQRYFYLSGNFNTEELANADVLKIRDLENYSISEEYNFTINTTDIPIVNYKGVAGILTNGAISVPFDTIKEMENREFVIQKEGVNLGTAKLSSIILVTTTLGEDGTAYDLRDYISNNSTIVIRNASKRTIEFGISMFNSIDNRKFLVTERLNDEEADPITEVTAPLYIDINYKTVVANEEIEEDTTNYTVYVNKVDLFNRNQGIATANSLTLTVPAKEAYVKIRPVIVNKYAPNESIHNGRDELVDFANSPYSYPPYFSITEDGYTRHILFGIAANESLEDNQYGLKFTTYSSEDEDEPGYRLYNFFITKTNNGVTQTVLGPIIVSLTPSALDKFGNSAYLGDLITKTDLFKNKKFTFIDRPTEYENLMNDIASAVPTSDVNPYFYDIILNQERDSSYRNELEQRYISITDESLDKTKIKPIGPNLFEFEQSLFTTVTSYLTPNNEIVNTYACSGEFAQGSSGSLDGMFADGTLLSNKDMETLKTYLKVKAYEGFLTEEIFDKNNFPFDVVMDSNEPMEVKQAIMSLSANEERKDFFTFLDLNRNPNYLEAINKRQRQLGNINTFYAAIYGQHAIFYDPYNNAEFEAPFLYSLSTRVPELDSTSGVHEILAGYGNGEISNYKEDSLSFIPNRVQADELYKNRINYAVKDIRNTRFMTQKTSQLKNTPLSDIFAIRVLLRMKREGEIVAERYQNKKKKYILNNFKNELDNAYLKYLNNESCDYINTSVYQNDDEIRRKIMRAKVEVKFADIIESFIFDFIVKTA